MSKKIFRPLISVILLVSCAGGSVSSFDAQLKKLERNFLKAESYTDRITAAEEWVSYLDARLVIAEDDFKAILDDQTLKLFERKMEDWKAYRLTWCDFKGDMYQGDSEQAALIRKISYIGSTERELFSLSANEADLEKQQRKSEKTRTRKDKNIDYGQYTGESAELLESALADVQEEIKKVLDDKALKSFEKAMEDFRAYQLAQSDFEGYIFHDSINEKGARARAFFQLSSVKYQILDTTLEMYNERSPSD